MTNVLITTEGNEAIKRFVEVFADGMLASGVGESLTCTEVETLADLLRAFGEPRAAECWIECHAEQDDCGDSHCTCAHCTSDDAVECPDCLCKHSVKVCDDEGGVCDCCEAIRKQGE